MKNTLLKVWGIVLTLAILSGLLMATVPMSAAATPNTWTTGNNPIPMMGNQTNIYTIAGDGTTMFLWTPTSTALSKSVLATDTVINVSSTDGFPASGTISIDGSADFAYNSITSNTFVLAAAAGVAFTVNIPPPPAAAVAPVVTAGTTIKAAALYKSLDAGKTWSASGLTVPVDTTLAVPVNATVTMIKINANDSTQMVATDGSNLYRSVTGGRIWTGAIPAASIVGGASSIYSLDIATDANGTTILVGTDTGVGMLNGALGSWSSVGNNWTAGDKAMAVAFAPDYIDAQEILAVAVGGGNSTLRVIVPPAATGSNQWGQGLIDSTLAATGSITSATIAFPNDFAASSKVFVGINGGTAPDVYRVTLQNKGAVQVVKATSIGGNVASVVVIGSGSNATILAGFAAGGVTASVDADTSSTPTWTAVAKGPVGLNVMLAAVDTTVYAGTSYDAVNTKYPAFFVSTDMNVFNGISFFEVPNVYTVSIINFGASAWMTGGGINRLFMNTASGWQMVLDNGANGWGVPSGAPGSKTMYFSQTGNSTLLMKTTDGGQTWVTVGTGFKSVTALTVIDDNTYWIGYNGYIKSNAGVALPISTVAENPVQITMVGDTGILVKTGAGPSLQTWLYSADSGATFTVLGTVDQFAGRPTTYVAAEKTVYVVDSSNAIWTWKLGTDTAWQATTITQGLTIPNGGTIGAIGVIAGVYYLDVNTNNTTGVNDPQLYRSTTPYFSEFRGITGSSINALKGTFGFTFGIPNADGTQSINGGLTYDSTIAPYPAGKNNSIPISFLDTVVPAISLTGPTDQIFVNNPVTFTWKAANATPPVYYSVQVAYDSAMTLMVANYPQYTTNTTLLNTTFTTGTTYYWRVRVESALSSPPATILTNGTGISGNTGVTSKWSATSQFTIKTEGSNSVGIDDPNSVYPVRGQVNVSTSPVLTWGIVQGATYNIQIATDSGFNTVVDSKNGLTVAVYTPSAALKANTTYYWEVQAVANGIASDWVAFAFTTAPVAAPTGTGGTQPPVTVTMPTPIITVTVPTQPAQSLPPIVVTVHPGGNEPTGTPAWAWIVIAIGAVLVIAVIVLIVRTRRV